MEKKLNQQERLLLLEQLFEESDFAIGVATLEGTIILANRKMAGFYGCSVDELIGYNFKKAYPRKSREKMLQVYDHAIQHGSWVGDRKVYHPFQKVEIQVRQYLFLLHDEKGVPAYFGIFFTDREHVRKLEEEKAVLQSVLDEEVRRRTREMSATVQTLESTNQQFEQEIIRRSRLEASLQAREEQFRTLVDNSMGLIFRLRIREPRRAMFISDKIKEFTGFPSSYFLGTQMTRFWDMIHAKDRQKVLDTYTEIAQSKRDYLIEYRLYHRDGSMRWMQERGQVISDFNGVSKWVDGILLDISEQKRVESNIKEAHQRHRLLIDATDSWTWQIDEDFRYVDVDANAEGHLGYPPAHFLNNRRSFFSPKTKVITPQIKKEHLERRRPFSDLLMRVRHANGEEVITQSSGIPLYNDDQKFIGYWGVSGVVTEQFRKREKEERERRRLRQLVSASDRDHRLIAYEIHDGLVQLVSGASMQLDAFGRFLQDIPEPATQLFELAKAHLQDAIKEARLIINNLRPPILDEQGIIMAIEHLLYEYIERYGLDITFYQRTQEARYAPLLENSIFRIIQEALNNIVKHASTKKAKVVLREEKVSEPEDGRKMASEEGTIHVEVSDQGVGFDPGEMESGGGFGLTGIQERTRMFEGEVKIESAPGEGTKIKVLLPLIRHEDPGESMWFWNGKSGPQAEPAAAPPLPPEEQ